MKFWREAASLILAVRPRQVRLNPSISSMLASRSIDSNRKEDASASDKSSKRNDLEDYKVLMLKRNSSSSFMPSRLVFPGGVLQKVDHSTAWLDLFKKVSNSSMDDLSCELHRDGSRPPIISEMRNWDVKPDIAFRICAIREAFEESGVLLVMNTDQAKKRSKGVPDLESRCAQWRDSTVSSSDLKMLESWRSKIQKSSTEFIRMCHELEVVPNIWSLYEWSNWLTPVFEKVVETDSNKPIRFDTMFYLSCFDIDDLPEVSSDDKETTVAEWRNPSEYLQLQSEAIVGRPKMAPPQVYELERMKNLNNLDELNAVGANHSCIQDQPRLMGVMKMCSDAFIMLLPGDYLYPNEPDYEGTRNDSDDVVKSSYAELTVNDKDKNLHRIIFKDKKTQDGLVVRQMKSSL